MSNNPLLSKVKLPGRVFQLPSKGAFYEQGILADSVKDGEIQVRPMSALAEMKLRSVDLLFSGKALKEVCVECAPDILKPEQLISKDVDALFCFLRIVTYGAEMTVRSVHSCNTDKIHDYAINLETLIMNPNNKILEHKEVLYSVELPTGQKVNLKPVTFKDAIDCAHMRQELETKMFDKTESDHRSDHRRIEALVIRDLMSVIKSVEVEVELGKTTVVTDPQMIDEWIRSLQTTHINAIIDQAKACDEWGFDLKVKLSCKECGEVYSHDLELNPVNFFSG